MKYVSLLFVTFLVVASPAHSAERAFDVRLLFRPVPLGLIGGAFLCCTGTGIIYSDIRQKQLRKKTALLHGLKPFVAAASEYNSFGSADDMALLVATDRQMIPFLPGHLSNPLSNGPSIIKQRVAYLRSDAIWGRVETMLREEEVRPNTEFANLAAEAEEYNRFKLLRSVLPQLLAPQVKKTNEALAAQKARVQQSLDTCPISYGNFTTSSSPDPFDCDWEIYNGERITNSHVQCIKKGLKQLGFTLLDKQTTDFFGNKLWDYEKIWDDACQIIEGENYISMSEKEITAKVENCNNAVFQKYEPLKFKDLITEMIKKYQFKTIPDDIQSAHAFDYTEFFYSDEFKSIKQIEPAKAVNLSINDGLMEIDFVKQKGLVGKCEVVKWNAKSGSRQREGKPAEFKTDSPQVRRINQNIVKNWHRDQQKQNLDKNKKLLAHSLEKRNPEEVFVERTKLPRYIYYPLSLLPFLSEKIALQRRAPSVSKTEKLKPVADVPVKDQLFLWDKEKLQSFCKPNSATNFTISYGAYNEAVHYFCVAFDECEKTREKHSYVEYIPAEDFDKESARETLKPKLKVAFPKIRNTYVELARTGKDLAEHLQNKANDKESGDLLYSQVASLLKLHGVRDSHLEAAKFDAGILREAAQRGNLKR